MSRPRRLPLPAVLLCLHSATRPHTSSRVLLCLPSQPPGLASHVTSAAFRAFLSRNKSPAGSVLSERESRGSSPAGTEPDHAGVTGPTGRLAGSGFSLNGGQEQDLEEPPRHPGLRGSALCPRRKDQTWRAFSSYKSTFLQEASWAAVQQAFQWPLTKPAEHHGCTFSLFYNTDDVHLTMKRFFCHVLDLIRMSKEFVFSFSLNPSVRPSFKQS